MPALWSSLPTSGGAPWRPWRLKRRELIYSAQRTNPCASSHSRFLAGRPEQRAAERVDLVNPALWKSPKFHFHHLLVSPGEGNGREEAAVTLATRTNGLRADREGQRIGRCGVSTNCAQKNTLQAKCNPGLPQDHSPPPRPRTPPRCSHLPCFVMIISVWWRWNLSHRGRLQR